MESTDRKAGASADINPVKEDESTARLSASCAMKVNGLDINVGVDLDITQSLNQAFGWKH